MTSAILAVISLLTLGPKQEILSESMDNVLIKMERIYKRQGETPYTKGCEVVDNSVESSMVINIFECGNDVEFFIVFDLSNKKRFRVRNYKDSVFNNLNR